jgi:nicotinamide-nucleotide amidase
MLSKKKSETIREYFLENKETIAVAESVTSGMLQVLISNITDAAEFYQGGITTYNIGQKCKHIGVEPIHAQSCNCVSPKVAEQMAYHVCQLFNSDWGISVTGYASPVTESAGKLFCYYAICYRGAVQSSGRIDAKKMLPEKVQLFFGRTVSDDLINVINNLTK